ncbi:MAG: GIY-YIG nuclease family protein [Bacteroidales bacterium]|nr:GIY-YIG nuclease family protein [Bacteroidales bacterium]
MYYVYVIKSASTGKQYIGITSNLMNKLKSGNLDFSAHSEDRGPWQLLYKEEYQTHNEALKREAFLKSHKGSEFLHDKLGGKFIM